MDGLRADDQGVHIQHAIESRNDVENWAPAGEGKIEPQELGHKAYPKKALNNVLRLLFLLARLLREGLSYIKPLFGHCHLGERACPTLICYL
jgi:hypothetical protein